jgi:hypothetical protein
VVFEYFDRRVHVRDLDRAAPQRFTDRLTSRPGGNGRLCDRSIANALTPLPPDSPRRCSLCGRPTPSTGPCPSPRRDAFVTATACGGWGPLLVALVARRCERGSILVAGNREVAPAWAA